MSYWKMKNLFILCFILFSFNGYAQTPSDEGNNYYKIALQYASKDNLDLSKAAHYMLKAAEAGCVEAQYKYAMMCLELGVQLDKKGEEEDSKWCADEFKKWILKAASQGHEDALEWVEFMENSTE